jgi:hypothetical protein
VTEPYEPYCPCRGQCHHSRNPCSLACFAKGIADPLAKEVFAEGLRAKALHGEPADRTGLRWLAILAEEFGEAAMEVTQGEVPPENRPRDEYHARLRKELVQVASVAERWVRAIDRGEPL